jgi:spoIIIJ-associated protein
MVLTDKVAAANKINDLMKTVLAHSGLRLKYRIAVNPAATQQAEEKAEITVDFSGPDAPMVTARGAELLNALEHLALKAVHLDHEDHDKLSFDCKNFKVMRRQELKLAADVAAERVRKTKMPYEFAPMNSRERRLVHLHLANETDLKTESSGEGSRRMVVVYPKDYQVGAPARKPFGRGRR